MYLEVRELSLLMIPGRIHFLKKKKNYLHFSSIDLFTVERANELYSYYLPGQTLELICKFRYNFENEINIKWNLPNNEVAKNVCLKYLKK